MTKQTVDRVVATLLLLAMLVVIFMFSAQNSQESDEVSGGVIQSIAKLFNPDFEQLTEAQKLKIIEAWQSLVRTLGHFTEYAALGFLAANAARSYGLKRLLGIAAPFAFSVIYAISDEIHQLFVPGRSCELKDLLVDSFGSLLGVLLFTLGLTVVTKLIKKRRKHKF